MTYIWLKFSGTGFCQAHLQTLKLSPSWKFKFPNSNLPLMNFKFLQLLVQNYVCQIIVTIEIFIWITLTQESQNKRLCIKNHHLYHFQVRLNLAYVDYQWREFVWFDLLGLDKDCYVRIKTSLS